MSAAAVICLRALSDPMHEGTRPVFVYGTLTDADRADAVLEAWRFDAEAVLEGLRLVDGPYPTLAPGGETPGRLLVTPEIDALDAYERVTNGLYERVALPPSDGGEAWCYVGDPDRLDAPVDWPGEGAFARRVRRYCRDAGVRVRPLADG